MILDSVLFVVTATPIAFIAYWLWNRMRKRRTPSVNRPHISPKDFPSDKVILFHIGPSAWCPTASPFVLKLQTYLRMAQIPHECVCAINRPSSKGKFPWILYDGKETDDSSFIIDYLNRVRGVDPNSYLDDASKGISRAFQKLLEEEVYWLIMVYRHGPKTTDSLLNNLVPGLPPPVLQFVRQSVQENAWAQGIGRHTPEQQEEVLRKDLGAISHYMGTNTYFMGAQPSQVDTTLFGVLAQIQWQMPGSPAEKMLKNEFPNLSAYCERMKRTYFKDWDDLITHGGTREPKG